MWSSAISGLGLSPVTVKLSIRFGKGTPHAQGQIGIRGQAGKKEALMGGVHTPTFYRDVRIKAQFRLFPVSPVCGQCG